PRLLRAGYARVATEYDDRGHPTRRTHFGPDGKVTKTAAGYAVVVTRHDDRGRVAGAEFLDANGQPVRTRVVVARGAPGGVGARAGLRPGDVLERYDGRPVALSFTFLEWRQEAPGSRPRELVLRRRGAEVTLPLPPGPLGAEVVDVARPAP